MRPLASVLAALVLALLPLPGLAQEAEESTAVADLMAGLANGIVKKANNQIAKEVVGWTLTSLGLQGGSNPDAAILAALAEIEATLQAMEEELADIEELLAQQSCQNAANVPAVQDALHAIDIWVGRGAAPAPDSYMALVNDAQLGIDVTTQMEALFAAALAGNAEFPPLSDLMVGLDDALRDQGNAEQLISACGLLVPAPSGEWDDRTYFQQLIDLVGFYAEYQARAALLITEAYHWRALQAWIAAGNDPVSLSPEQVPSICSGATGDVLTWCVEAEDAFANIRTNLRAQYGEAGAPYSTGTPSDPDAAVDYDAADPVVQVRNESGFVWVKDIDDFFAKGGYATSCQDSTSKKPCGPGVGHYDHLTFEKYGSSEPLLYGAYGGYTTWRPAPAGEWTALTASWSGSSTTLAQLLGGTHGFAGASTPRVYFTSDVDTSGHDVTQENVTGSNRWHFLATKVACFVATPMNRGNSPQPFCSSGFGNLMHGARDHSQSGATCYTANSDDHGTLDDAGIDTPFFDFLYTMQEYRCKSSSHPEGQTFYPAPPGWLVEHRSWKSRVDDASDVSEDTGIVAEPGSRLHDQYHWPAFDAKAVACSPEPATGRTRSRYALDGRTTVPRLCGADFDAWFEKWVAPPADAQSAPQLATPAPIVVLVAPGSNADLAHHEVTVPVHFAEHVAALDAEDGELPVSCFPESGAAFQLGTTEVLCRAADSAGARVEEVFEVRVQYPFRFAGQVGDATPLVARAGRSIPIAFHLGGDRGLDVVTAGGPSSLPVDCESGAPLAEPEPTASAGGLRGPHGSDLYRYTWRTDETWAGQCRDFRLELADGSVHAARIVFAPGAKQGHGHAKLAKSGSGKARAGKP